METKTLDDVIDQHEYCLTLGLSACGDCRYRDADGVCRMREHALHFLKELRYILDNIVWVKPEEKGHWEIKNLIPETMVVKKNENA